MNKFKGVIIVDDPLSEEIKLKAGNSEKFARNKFFELFEKTMKKRIKERECISIVYTQSNNPFID